MGAQGTATSRWLIQHQAVIQLCGTVAGLAAGGALRIAGLAAAADTAWLAAAVISVMLASGRALENWAAHRARRDLSGLLERVPRTARLYRGQSLVSVPLEEMVPGQVVQVAHGDVIPADGTVKSPMAVLDESALTGESLPVEHPAGDRVRSG